MVWPFSKDPQARPFKLNIAGVVIVFILILVILQTVGILFGLSGVKLGPIFMLILVSAIVLISFAIAKKQIQGIQISKKDIGALIVIGVVTILALFYLREFVPEIFTESLVELKIIAQSILPLS